MSVRLAQPVANGLRTDHPIPGLPFVDDRHLPLDDRDALEAVGRRRGAEGMWGRTDQCGDMRTGEFSGWVTFTTDPERQDYAWVVRWDDRRGRSVILYRDEDGAASHMDFWGPMLLARSGGYWWDGDTWYRPLQVWDRVAREYVRRPVPGGRTVSAAELLLADDGGVHAGDASRGRLLTMHELPRAGADSDANDHDVDLSARGKRRRGRAGADDPSGTAGPAGTVGPAAPASPVGGRWLDDLALWARHRAGRQPGELDPSDETTDRAPDGLPGAAPVRPLSECVVTINAPELSVEQLIGVAQMAPIGDVAASTLRAYIARDEADVPQPQAVLNGRPVWARPVAEEWAEQRRQSTDSVAAAVSTTSPAGRDRAVGVNDLWNRFSRIFFGQLWERPGQRKRWALRWRTQAAVRDVADELGWTVAANLRTIVPLGDLAITIRHAILDDLAGQRRDRTAVTVDDGEHAPMTFYAVLPPIARMLTWLIRHDPELAAATIAETIREAGTHLEIPRHVAVETLKTALELDGTGDVEAARVLDLITGTHP